jgi:hypothetical protein
LDVAVHYIQWDQNKKRIDGWMDGWMAGWMDGSLMIDWVVGA